MVSRNLCAIVFTLFISVGLSYGQEEEVLLRQLDTTQSELIKAELYNHLAELVMYSDPNKAIIYLEKAKPIYKNRKGRLFEEQFVINCNKYGIIYTMQNNFVKAIEYYHKAILITEKLATEYPEDKSSYDYDLASIYANIGSIYYHQKNYEQAIKSWRKTKNYLINDSLSENLPLILENLGIVYLDAGKSDSSLYYHQQALKYARQQNNEKTITICYTNLGEVYAAKGLYNIAMDYYKKSVELKTKLNDNYGLVNVYLSLAKLNYKMNQYEKCIKNAKNVINIGTESKYLKELREANKLLSDCYAKKGDYKSGLDYYKVYKNLNDSIFNLKSNEKFMEISTKYETQKKENELKLMKQNEISEKKIERILILSLVFAILFFTTIIYLLYLKRKKERAVLLFKNRLKEKENILIKTELEKSKLIERELNIKIDYKSKQLTTHALHMIQKNEILSGIMQMSDELLKLPENEIKQKIRSLKHQLKRNLKTENDWEIFKLQFEEVNKSFFDNLLLISPELNSYDLRHSALIKLNLNIKESASILNLSPHSVKSARYRLKKKLKLGPKDDLNEFIRQV